MGRLKYISQPKAKADEGEIEGKCMPQMMKKIGAKETVEFIKTLKRSKYSVVEKLKKLPVEISILLLLLPSEKRRDVLLKILNEFHTKDYSKKIS